MGYVLKHLQVEFTNLVSYSRFVKFIPSALIPLSVFLRSACFGNYSGVSFIDSTAFDVWDNRRIAQHRILKAWQTQEDINRLFFCFKLHLVINDCGEILNMMPMSGNVDGRKQVPELVRNRFGKYVGDRCYISQPLSKSS